MDVLRDLWSNKELMSALLGAVVGGIVTFTVAMYQANASDPEQLATFWSELLGRPIVDRSGPYVWMRREKGLGMGFQQADKPHPREKNRMHFDIASSDPAAEQQRVEALGGRRLEEYTDGGFLVMADPEGNEFCVIPGGSVSVGLDAQGRAHYLD